MKNKSISKRIISLIIAVLLALGPVAGTGVFAAEKKAPKYRLGLKRPVIVSGKITLEEYEEIEQRYSVSTRKRSLRSTNDYWKKFSQPYYNFANGLSEAQIDLYDRMYATLYGMIDGGPDLSEEADEESYLTPIVKSTGPMSWDEAVDVAYLLIYNHPELYFLDAGFRVVTVEETGEQTLRLCAYKEFGQGEVRTEKAAELKTIIESYREQITGDTLLEKEESIQDLIVENVEYEYGKYSQSCASVFFEKKSVCAGYAEAFNLLCNAEGIPAIPVTSDAHEWSQVMLDGRWYAVDVTWDDAEDPDYRFDFFNISDKTIKSFSDYSKEVHTIEESPWNYVGRPACCYDYPDIENHDWDEPEYFWSEDNKTCTAQRVCIGDKSHIEKEEATVTSKIVEVPTTQVMGTREYTANFMNKGFETQTKKVQDIPCTPSEQLEIDVSDETDVTIDEDVAETIRKDGKPLEIKGRDGIILFDTDAVKSIFERADEITFVMKDVTDTRPEYSSYDVVIECLVVDSEGRPLFPEGTYGKAKITVPYNKEVPEGMTVKVFFINDAGTKSEIDAVYDSDAKTVTFEVEHFSKYAIEQVEVEVTTVKSPPTGDNAPLLLFACIMVLGGAFLMQKVFS
ncbi:MAG: hypothetical protein E7241_09360 [Lachnospiraceae bacterium]|nr:hypothetical protein [Lachnospiraceae bacterium]